MAKKQEASAMSEGRKLNHKRQRFVVEYLIDLNATQAAIRAGYSAKSAKAIGCELLTFPDVLSEIEKAQKVKLDKTGITAEWVLDRLKREAEYEGEGASHSARVQALGLAAKHLGMMIDRSKVDVSVTERPQIVEYPVSHVNATPAAD